jgi:hypothetical protein
LIKRRKMLRASPKLSTICHPLFHSNLTTFTSTVSMSRKLPFKSKTSSKPHTFSQSWGISSQTKNSTYPSSIKYPSKSTWSTKRPSLLKYSKRKRKKIKEFGLKKMRVNCLKSKKAIN